MSVVCQDPLDRKVRHDQFRGSIDEFLSEDHFQQLKEIMSIQKSRKGHYLFWEEEAADKLYYICSGRVKLKQSTEEGRDFILSIMQKGDLLGEYGDHHAARHHYHAQIVEDGEIGIIQRSDLDDLMKQHGQLAVEFMKWLGWTQRKNESKFRDLLLFGKAGALASTLIRMSNSYGTKCADGIILGFKLTNAELGDFIGMTRENVNRQLSAWREEGTIDILDGQIVIHNLESLRRVCQCPSFPACPKEVCRI